MTDLLTLENTAIVMDSTCDPPDGWFDQPGLYIVPLKVHFGDQMFRDGVDMTYKEFFAKLKASDVLPTTSQPTAGEFVAAYEEALKKYEHVFSLHLSGEMSGTVRAAEQAAEQFDNVYVYDMRTVTSALVARRRAAAGQARGGRHARRRPGLRGELPRRVARARPRRDPRVPASRRPHRARRLLRRRRVRHQAAHPRCGRDHDRLRQGAGAEEGVGGHPALRRRAQRAGRRDVVLHHRRRQRRRAAAHPRADRTIRPNAHYVWQGHVAAVVGTHIGPGTAALAIIVE